MSHKSQTNSYTEFFYKSFCNILLISIPLVIISALILSLPHSSATTSSTDDITLTLDVACTVSSVVTSPHSALDMHVGQHKVGIGNTDISVLCNDNNGYSVYAIGNSNNIDGNTDLVSNIDDNYNIHTGTNITGNSAWAMKLTAGTGSASETTPPTIVNGYDNYNVIPSNYTQVAKRTSGTSTETDTSTSGSYFSTTYSIYAASTQPAGTYAGKVKYVMVHPNSNINTVPDLEAAFAAAGKQKYQSIDGNYYYAMQDTSSDICNSVTRNGDITATQLIDIRDRKTYWTAKLKDGHCWMTQNLDFDINTNATLNSNTTDLNVIYNSSIGQYAEYNNGYTTNNDVIYWTPVSTATTRDFQDNGPITDWGNSNSVPYSASKTDSTETGHASLGNWYNWTATIASNDSSTLTQNTVNDISQNPKNSICPKGWRLPTISDQSGILSGSTNEFARLKVLYDNVLNTPLFFVKAGYVSGNLSSMTSAGIYTSSTAYNLNSAWGGALEGSNFTIDWWQSKYSGRSGGWSVRCVARSAGE